MGRFRFWLLPPEKLISQTLLGLGWLLVRPRLWRLLGRLMASAGLPHGLLCRYHWIHIRSGKKHSKKHS